MPHISKGARLYLCKRTRRFIIRDGRFFKRTGYGPDKRTEAEEALADYIASRRPDTSRRHTHEIGVAEVLNLYQMDLPQNKPSRELVGYHVANLLQYWGDKSLAKVKGSTCREYLKSRISSSLTQASMSTSEKPPQRRKFVKPSTVRRELKTLSAAINHWHKESPLVAVPKVSLPDEGERRERVLERSEVARMLWACRKRKWKYVARFILIGLYTGSRHRAVLHLRWQASVSSGHFDEARGILYRKGSAERETSKRRPPHRCGERLLGHLRRWKRQDAALGFSHIVHRSGAAVLKIRKSWRTICEDSGLGREVTPHVLRHSAVSWLLWEGKTIWDVAGIVGADASTIERTYGHHRAHHEERKKA